MDRDVTTFMIGTYSGPAKDEFGTETSAERPLPLDTVMQGRRRRSRCRLLQLPDKILADIVDLLACDKAALASLALANSDCRQLARSRQFAEIQFDYSPQARQLLFHLMAEAMHPEDMETFIGPCVRRVTFEPHPEHAKEFHHELCGSIFGEEAGWYSHEQRRQLRRKANDYYTKLRTASALAVFAAMPNLEAFAWQDPFSIDEDFFGMISRSSAQHIRLSRVVIDEPWLMRPPLTPPLWPLRSLDLDVRLALSPDDYMGGRGGAAGGGDTDDPISPFFETLLQRCAPTLESLSWRHLSMTPVKIRISLGSHPPAFPRLQYLRLVYVSLHRLAFSALLAPTLRHLELPLTGLDGLEGCLTASRPLPDLESLVVSMLPLKSQACVPVARFIRRHKHVRKLLVHDYEAAHDDGNHLDPFIIPILAGGGFDNLCCLSLGWGADPGVPGRLPLALIPETALKTLGAIVSLERLSLRVGCGFGWKHQWLIDHNALQRHLKRLRRLKMLALVRDTYFILSDLDLDLTHAVRYYSRRFIGEEELAAAEAREHLDVDVTPADIKEDDDGGSHGEGWTWEKAHRNRMLTQAEEYAAVFPELEFVYCGQRPMGFRRDAESPVAGREAIPLTRHRDDCITFFHKTFGIA
ncbi:hypothetical protein Trco_008235 [Trichoderma cornu-damae]|uniref:F-box domain-containing protein n=1 Tax=Trichoderma cornu-damae TaxID=654480 RepID=A0A9P8QF47_9HYPO|nr:hypothetical protein Trco_008235 [Trichoderma cornu-damae]